MAKENYQKAKNIKIVKEIQAELPLFPSFVTQFVLSLESSTTPLTRINYLSDLALFFDWLANYILLKDRIDISLRDVDNVSSLDIEKFLSYLSTYEKDGKYLSNSDITKARKLSAIRSLLKFLFDRDMIKANVATKVRSPKIRQKEIVRLEADEVSSLLSICESPSSFSVRMQSYQKATRERDFAILSLLLGTGIRVSECVGIDLEDIDFKQNAFKITRKGGAQVVLYFSDEVRNALLDWIQKRNENDLISENEHALFLSLQNKRISVRAVENLVKKYATIASPLKKISPHKLRSTFGTNLYRETKDIYIVADVLGHKDVNTTKKHYAAISEDMRRDVANKVKLR